MFSTCSCVLIKIYYAVLSILKHCLTSKQCNSLFLFLQVVFAATVTTEFVTGNSLFRKMELQGIAEAIGVCLGAMTCAAAFAWLSSARNKVGRIFTVSCNSFIDSVIDQIVDGLFYESDSNDWSDDI